MGLIVFIGNPARRKGEVLVSWTPLGDELELLERVNDTAREPMMVLATGDASEGDVKAFYARHRASWRFGRWFARDADMVRAIRSADQRRPARTKARRATAQPRRASAKSVRAKPARRRAA
jgi:hypothetical protein